jgi:hypothetical protein
MEHGRYSDHISQRLSKLTLQALVGDSKRGKVGIQRNHIHELEVAIVTRLRMCIMTFALSMQRVEFHSVSMPHSLETPTKCKRPL